MATSVDELIRKRINLIRMLDELKTAGLLDYSLSSDPHQPPEPHLEVWSWPRKVMIEAPASVSVRAGQLWELIRTKKVGIALAIHAEVQAR